MSYKSTISWTDGLTDKIVARFESYRDTSGNCWLWTGGLFSNGYGQFRVGRYKVKAHRLAWVIMNGPIPDGKIVCHTCDVPRCVNPAHLWLGTDKQNIQDRDRKGRTGDGGSKVKKATGSVRGERNAAAKITPLIVRTIRKYRRMGHSYQAIIDGVEFSFGIKLSMSQIGNIVHGRCWSHVG